MKLTSRLVLAGVFLIVILAIVGVVLPRAVASAEVGQVDQQISSSAPVAIALTSGFGPSAPNGVGTRAAAGLGGIYVARVDGGSRDVAIAPSSAAGREPALPSVVSQMGHLTPMTVASTHGSGSWRAVRLSLPDGSQAIIAVSLDSVEATVQQMTVGILFAGAALIAAIILTWWWLLSLGLRPIAEVTSVADAIAGGERSRRVSGGTGSTEAAHLARAFNVMLDEQAATEAKLRQFVADASHELRNPVAAISGVADLWREGGIDVRDIDDVMRRLGQESARMRRLVEDLLLLARFDENPVLSLSDVDLVQLVGDVVSGLLAGHPSRHVSVDAPLPVIIECDETRIRQVVTNLMSNALTHTPSDATVSIGVQETGDGAVLTIADNGAGMQEDDVKQAFDRFWRAEASRTRSGTGLGLSIVRSLVEAHGGTVAIESAIGAGTTVRVVLPRVGSLPGAHLQT